MEIFDQICKTIPQTFLGCVAEVLQLVKSLDRAADAKVIAAELGGGGAISGVSEYDADAGDPAGDPAGDLNASVEGETLSERVEWMHKNVQRCCFSPTSLVGAVYRLLWIHVFFDQCWN